MTKFSKQLEKTNFSRGSKKWMIFTLIEAALFLTAGIVTIALYNKTFQVMFPAIGSLLIVMGVLRILLGFIPVITARDKDLEGRKRVRENIRYVMLIAASIFLALGIGLVVLHCTGNTGGISQFLQTSITLIATAFVTIGAVALLFGIALLYGKVDKIGVGIAVIIIGLAALAGGIVLFIYQNQTSFILQALTIIIGVLVAALGVLFAYDAFRTMAKK